MRAYKAYLMLLCRMSLGRVLLVIPALAAVDAALFLTAMGRAFARTNYRLSTIFDASHMDAAAAFAVLAVWLLLFPAGRERSFSPGQGYLPQSFTLRRLELSYRERYFAQALYKFLCFFILWAAQLAICLGLCLVYTLRVDPVLLTPHTLLLTFSQSTFLYTLLPLGSPLLWLRNVMVLLLPALDSTLLAMRASSIICLWLAWSPLRHYLTGPWALILPAIPLVILILFGLRKEVVYEFPANSQNP